MLGDDQVTQALRQGRAIMQRPEPIPSTDWVSTGANQEQEGETNGEEGTGGVIWGKLGAPVEQSEGLFLHVQKDRWIMAA
jgi:hypothetical protein